MALHKNIVALLIPFSVLKLKTFIETLYGKIIVALLIPFSVLKLHSKIFLNIILLLIVALLIPFSVLKPYTVS